MRVPFIRILITFALMCGAGCGAPHPVEAALGKDSGMRPAERVWPAPPAPARIRYVRSFSRPADLGIGKSLYGRLVDSLVGAREDRFVRPTGVAERDGIIYVADPDAQSVWILDPGRGRYRRVDTMGSVAFMSPVAVAVRADGSAFVADTGLKKIVLLGREGRLPRIFAAEGLERPAGVAFDDVAQRLYVADSALHRIFVYGGDGSLLATWGHAGTAAGEFNYPTHVWVERDGTVLVTDAMNFRVQAFDRDGKPLWRFGRHGDGSGDLAAPKGVASDAEGHVYLVDALFDTVQIFDRDGTLLLAFGEKGAEPGEFWLPGGLFVGEKGRIFVTDGYNRRVQLFVTEPGSPRP